MSNALLVVLVVLGFASIAGLFVYLTVLDAGTWRRKLDDILLPIGFQRCDAAQDKAHLAHRLQIVNRRHPGKRLLMHLYRRAAAGHDATVYVCDYHFASASGRGRGGQWLLVCLVSGTLSLPAVSIERVPGESDVAGKLFRAMANTFELPGMQRMRTGTASMDARFHVYLANTNTDTSALHALLEVLAASSTDASLDTQGDIVVLSSTSMMADRVRQVLDSQKLQGQIQLASRLYEALLPRRGAT